MEIPQECVAAFNRLWEVASVVDRSNEDACEALKKRQKRFTKAVEAVVRRAARSGRARRVRSGDDVGPALLEAVLRVASSLESINDVLRFSVSGLQSSLIT